MISPTDRISLIGRSLEVFVLGIIGVLPVVGFIPALLAVTMALRLGRRYRGDWNPAAVYVRVGVGLALLSIGVSLIAFLILAGHLLPPYGRD
jgi:hypothetical protein